MLNGGADFLKGINNLFELFFTWKKRLKKSIYLSKIESIHLHSGLYICL